MKRYILAIALLSSAGCGYIKPFEPNKLETIGSNEEGFLIPLTGDTTKQTSTNNEEFLARSLISTKQVRIPQQWVQRGYAWGGYNGEYRDAAVLIKVALSPVTRHWTAEKNRGTSAEDQAIWVMTADQVEFSTGWTCTARIASREDAVKFLHNYPNGSLEHVLDNEVRMKLQADFGLEVTDLMMDKLRTEATPHIAAVKTSVISFFAERGVQITNLGISGGFVYKNPSIQEKLVNVFNAESDKSIAIAETQAQIEKNKTIQLAAEAKAAAILTEKEAEAKGIEAVTIARKKEMEAAGQDLKGYQSLKQVEVLQKIAERWDGTLPRTIFGGAVPNIFLPLPDEDK